MPIRIIERSRDTTIVAVPRPLQIVQRELGLTNQTIRLIATCPKTSRGLIDAHAEGRTREFFHQVDWTRLSC